MTDKGAGALPLLHEGSTSFRTNLELAAQAAPSAQTVQDDTIYNNILTSAADAPYLDDESALASAENDLPDAARRAILDTKTLILVNPQQCALDLHVRLLAMQQESGAGAASALPTTEADIINTLSDY
jgi:hypothetical protein